MLFKYAVGHTYEQRFESKNGYRRWYESKNLYGPGENLCRSREQKYVGADIMRAVVLQYVIGFIFLLKMARNMCLV